LPDYLEIIGSPGMRGEFREEARYRRNIMKENYVADFIACLEVK
jgi:hypothetical protein